jgi:hypothetical protein
MLFSSSLPVPIKENEIYKAVEEPPADAPRK